ncbi:hypothetical protein [Catenuloplanes japonicus]|uniref:hypothetical protein n=1 Tax=Catenuloplanes japonicus TaxID=33876 RepID=UPI0005253F59|nr:hypothetical protein [Catenuloplanes japonicus]
MAFGLGPAVWIGGTFATAEADTVPGNTPHPSPTVSISTVYIAVEPSDTPDFSDIADAWVPPSSSPSASPSPSLSPTPSKTPPSPSPSVSPSASPSITPPASSGPPTGHTPTPPASTSPSADPSLAA